MTRAADQSRAWRQQNPARMLWYDAQRRAQKRRVPCTLTASDVVTLLEQGWVCSYCEQLVGSYVGGQRPQSVTLDRLYPDLGYVPGNVVLACHSCNANKGDHTPETLRAWADRIERVINRLNPNPNE